MNTSLPFSVTEYVNRSGTTSFRVQGYVEGKRMRQNFAERAAAEKFCNDKNAATLTSVPSRWDVVQTTLTEQQVRQVEAAVTRIANRWKLDEVLEEGIAAMLTKRAAEPVVPLAETWLSLVKHEVSSRWYSDLHHRVTTFTKAHPKLSTTEFTRGLVRGWLDQLDLAQQSKANMRNAIHRWCVWMVERGYLAENPAAQIRITRRRSGAMLADRELPTVFTPLQAEALLRACELGACRRLLGWMSACLFTGLRPDSEAPRATWSEVSLRTREWSVMGRKRGAKPRVVRLTDAAVAWIKVVQADRLEKPALYSRRAKERAIELANEWLREKHPEEKPVVWDEDITRHTFASYRSPQIPVHDLAAEMGNSPAMIYGHYRHPRPAAEVEAFWRLRPTSVG